MTGRHYFLYGGEIPRGVSSICLTNIYLLGPGQLFIDISYLNRGFTYYIRWYFCALYGVFVFSFFRFCICFGDCVFLLISEDQAEIEEEKKTQDVLIKNLLARSEYLLATILIANNLVNVAVVMLLQFFHFGNDHIQKSGYLFFVSSCNFNISIVAFRRDYAEDLCKT